MSKEEKIEGGITSDYAPGVGYAKVEGPKRVVLQENLELSAIMTPDGVLLPWTQIEARFKDRDPHICDWVAKTMEATKQWAGRPDSYYMGLFRPETPFGRGTITCPFHPLMFNWVPFDWDPDKPWRLTCPFCNEEGRKPDYYPNDSYPDEGKGCRPTNEVWKNTHTPEWSAKHRIPWDRWDGHTHGHVDGHNFYFMGCAQFRIFFEMNHHNNILGTMCKAYLFGSRLYPAGSNEWKLSAVCAHKAKLIMVTMARTIMGDGYLQDVLGIDRQSYRQAVDALGIGLDGNVLLHKEYPGYKRRDVISDHSADDPEHPIEAIRIDWWKKVLTIFPDKEWSIWANVWLISYAMIQDSFTPTERKGNLAEMIDRLLVSKAGDTERLKKHDRSLRRGVIEYGMHPYDLSMRGNLSGWTAQGNLNLGLTLKDREIVRNVAADIWFFLRNYFTGEGLGNETSPHYTQVASSNISPSLSALNGIKEGFGPGDPFWDNETESLQPYKDPALAAVVYSPLLSVLPDGRCAAWVDSWITEEPSMGLITKVANATGGILKRYMPWLDVTKDDRGKFQISLKKELTLPSYVIGANRMLVMRTGLGKDQTLVSVDWSRKTGHSHDGPFNLLLYGARHEMLFDQGYLNNVTPNQAWMNSAESHNTALVRSADGSTADCIAWRGSLRYFADTPQVLAVEVAEENRDLLRKIAPNDQDVLYQRTVVLIPTENPYVVDIFRIQGGATHDYYVHSMGKKLSVTGATLKAEADRKKSLYDISGFTYPTDTGARVITGISRAKTDEPFTATWSDMREWRSESAEIDTAFTVTWNDMREWWSESAEIDTDAVTRVRMLGSPGTEIFVGNSFGQRYIDGPDVAERVNVMCVRRKAESSREVPDAFVAVIDATRSKVDNIKQLRQLQVLSGDKAAVGVKITHIGGTDYVLSTTDDDIATSFIDPDVKKEIALTGRLGVIRTETGEAASLVLVQGRHLVFGDKAISTGSASFNGRLIGFNNRNLVLTIESNAAIPTETAQAGRVLIVRHARQADAYTISRIDRLAPGRYGITVADTMSLARCMVRVKSIKGESVAIEPAPILYRENDFFVYREDQAGHAVLLAPYKGETKEVFDEQGTIMGHYTVAQLGECKGIKPGMRLLISTLQTGRDTVSIPVIRSTTRSNNGSAV